MSIRDDEQLEKYLKQFRPVEPEPLLVKELVRERRRPLVLAAWGAVAAAVLLAVLMALLIRKPAQPAQQVNTRRPLMEEFSNPEPLTIARANALLSKAPSFKAAVDDMAFRPESKPISEGRYSLLALLSEEEAKQ